MKLTLLTTLAVFSSFIAFSQSESFGLLKYTPPTSWQQQSRADFVSYLAAPQAEGITEIIVYSTQPGGAPRIDSSYRSEWRRLMKTGVGEAIPNPRKRTTYSGIAYAENGAEVTVDGVKKFMQLMVFSLEDKIQSIGLVANDLASFRRARDQVYDFLESIDTVYKRGD